MIASLAGYLGKYVLIIVNHTQHGKCIETACRRNRIKAEFIHGKLSVAHQQNAIQRLNDGELNCLISTPVIDEGISVDNIKHIIYAAGYKSEIQVIQRVGRGKRKKTEGKNLLTIWDLADQGNNRCEKNSRQRFSVYKQITKQIEDVKLKSVINVARVIRGEVEIDNGD